MRPEGKTTNRLWSIGILDPLSTFVTATTNIGPIAVVPVRIRDPQTEVVTMGWGGSMRKGVNLTTDPHRSQVEPAFPLVGSATFDPKADDWKLMQALSDKGLKEVRDVFGHLVGAPAESAPREPAPQAR
jgi:hypothetical protein